MCITLEWDCELVIMEIAQTGIEPNDPHFVISLGPMWTWNQLLHHETNFHKMWAQEPGMVQHLFDKHILGDGDIDSWAPGWLPHYYGVGFPVQPVCPWFTFNFSISYTETSTKFSLNISTLSSINESCTPLAKEILKQHKHINPAIYLLGTYLSYMLIHMLKTCTIIVLLVTEIDKEEIQMTINKDTS